MSDLFIFGYTLLLANSYWLIANSWWLYSLSHFYISTFSNCFRISFTPTWRSEL